MLVAPALRLPTRAQADKLTPPCSRHAVRDHLRVPGARMERAAQVGGAFWVLSWAGKGGESTAL